MSGFLLLYILVYGLLFHGYGLAKLRQAFHPSRKWLGLGVFWAVIFTALPVATRMAERAGLVGEARLLAYAGYLWMGFVFLFVVVAAGCDVIRLAVSLSGRKAGRLREALLPPRRVFRVSAAVALLVSIYGWFEARDIRVQKVVVETARLAPGSRTIRVAQISDVHLGLIVGERRLARIAELIRGQEPDILLSTGDLVDGHFDGYDELVRQLRSLNPPLGKYAITGNHEFYAGIDHSLAFSRAAGFEVLRGEARTVAGLFTLVGVDDPAGRFFAAASFPAEEELLAGVDRTRPVILMKHRPEMAASARGIVDLQLSGHAHKGQIFPFGLVTSLFYPAPAGLSRPHARSFLYVSRGTGTWGPPIRFLSPPEITLFELVPARRK